MIIDPDDLAVVMEKGLKVGEKIVADGGHKVRKGMKVTPAP